MGGREDGVTAGLNPAGMTGASACSLDGPGIDALPTLCRPTAPDPADRACVRDRSNHATCPEGQARDDTRPRPTP